MEYSTHILSNGLRVIHKRDTGAVTYCGLVINAGSRDETSESWGFAHFIEHMLFKGTKKRSSNQIINRLEDIGGELNAYTSKEETVVYATILNEYTNRALELLADITFNSTFPVKEIEKELVIINDEIQSYFDSPSELIYDEFEEMIFNEHSIGHNILGTPEIIQTFNEYKAKAFVEKYYQPNQMVLFVLGNHPFDKLIRLSEKYFSASNSIQDVSERIPPIHYKPNTTVIKRDTFQSHVLIGNRTFNLYHGDRMAMYLLNNILGGPGMNSLLNLSLREKNGLVYQVDSSFQPMTDTGIWTIYYGCDPENEKKCRNLVLNTLNNLKDKKFKSAQLDKYKLQLLGQMTIASENKENLALSLGKSFLRYNKVDNLTEIKEYIMAISSDKLYEIANDVYSVEKISILKYA